MSTITHLYRIRLAKPAGGSFIHRETYYESKRLTKAERATLEEAGWCIAESRIHVTAEYARLTNGAHALSRASASTAGASSVTHGLALHAAAANGLAADLMRAAQGNGSLRS